MAIKYICDNCKQELDKKFYCEIVKREIKVVSNLFNSKQVNMQPQLAENHYHLCEKCFNEKLKDMV